MPGLAAAYEKIVRLIAEACVRVQRDPATVRLVAVSKSVPAERVRELFELGHDLFGENRVQEALRKIDALGSGPRWHMIGHLQTNKVRQVIGRFEMIHGVDSIRLVEEIDKHAARAGTVERLLVQANLAGEETKFGVPAADVERLLEKIAKLEHVRSRGLMTIPPPVDDPQLSRRWFAGLSELRDRCAMNLGLELPELSMGMTSDFEVAVEEGATLVRVGRAIFGERG